MIANSLKVGIGQIVSETQSGFIKERSIQKNIMFLDLLNYNYLIEDNGFILFLDFYKAFDWYFSFGSKFIKVINMMYYDIIIAHIPSLMVHLEDLRLNEEFGRAALSLLYCLFELWKCWWFSLKNSQDMEPLNVLGNLFITQLADDTTILFKRSEQLPLVMKNIEKFSKASGLHFILKKCELIAIQGHTWVTWVLQCSSAHCKGLAPTEKADQKTND